MNEINTHLGKTSQYKTQYDPTLLVGEPRQRNRDHLNIVGTRCIDGDTSRHMYGFDTWNGYEFSCLMNSGLPVTGQVKFEYSANTKNIVESKSVKLYFNSFNGTKMGDTVKECFANVEKRAIEDLSKTVGGEVKVKIFPAETSTYYDNDIRILRSGAITLEKSFNPTCTKYQRSPDILKRRPVPVYGQLRELHSSLLKSNCKVTSQPDFGDVFIIYEADKWDINFESLLEYIVSYRDECHFHEEICESIFSDLLKIIEPKMLFVECFYTRRGGWDINPCRLYSIETEDIKNLVERTSSVTENHFKTSRQ